MSLINEALKKAQRRQEGAAGADANGPIVKRAQPKSARSTLLLVVGGIALVVVSIALTAFWLSWPASAPAVAAVKPAATTTPPPAAPERAAPVVTVPSIVPPTATKPAVEPAPPESKPAIGPVPPATLRATQTVAPTTAPASSPPPAAEKTPTPSSSVTPASAATRTATSANTVSVDASAKSEPTVAAKPDERIHQYVEAIHVTGIRSSGNESKVLMNDRVYRVNDIVDRTLGIRLTKVAPDSLTFTDANGVTYVKYF